MPFFSTKTYGHEEGLSCAFRQWRATHSHCQHLHGYALSFKFVFAADTLDQHGWVMDFGGLKEFKTILKQTFDHVVAVAGDDPDIESFATLHRNNVANVRFFGGGVGAERFAKYAFDMMHDFLIRHHQVNVRNYGLRVVSCECAEHGANSAIYTKEKNESAQD